VLRAVFAPAAAGALKRMPVPYGVAIAGASLIVSSRLARGLFFPGFSGVMSFPCPLTSRGFRDKWERPSG
jgi:hypothetical protein